MKKKDELDELFAFENNKQDLVAEAKRKSTVRMTFISGLVSLFVLILIVLIKLQVTPWLLDRELAAQEVYFDVYGANLFIGPWEESIRLLDSEATAPQYKLVDGQPVYLGEISNSSRNREVYLSPNDYETYNYSGEKVMNFIHPATSITHVPMDVMKLDMFNDQQKIEMGISFDQPYSLSEVEAMLPEESVLQWAWVDVYTDEEVKGNEPARVFTENEVIGFSMVDEAGTVLESPVEKFMESVVYGKNHRGPYKQGMEEIYEQLKQKDEVEETTIKIVGAVVVGKKEELQQFQNEPRVRASSIGAVINQFN
ncbi:anti sigma factor C-terminal domain-containing protein [Planococcus sp. ANT_H30]|uniref:anti sigma factor C-terminal domain-containing protein n=1 Tax=Planococcus sp. ANT_H30 TaxID=2597347 RepID=UPI00165D48B6|nr:anti sigma factor C-terminal domain-containing protein [Planococcus sp. ANT_H30]